LLLRILSLKVELIQKIISLIETVKRFTNNLNMSTFMRPECNKERSEIYCAISTSILIASFM
jgi:hypothetical protein